MKKNLSYHHGNLKQDLVQLALDKLKEGIQPGALSIRALANELGVSPGAPYRHFNDSKALIAHLATLGFLELTSRMDPQGDFSKMGQAYVSFAIENPQWYQTMYYLPRQELDVYTELFAASYQAYQELTNGVSRLQKQKKSEMIPPSLAAFAAWGYVHGLAQLAIQKLSFPVNLTEPRVLEILSQVMLTGL